MVSRVLVPMDDSEIAEQALRYALDVHGDAQITVLHVVGEPSGMMGEVTRIALATDIEAAAQEYARDVLEHAEAVAEEYGVEIETIVEVGHPARAIVNRSRDFDTVVLGSHGGTLADRLFIGDVAQRVFRRSPVPVTVVR